jgi:hypothetical protein
MTEAIQGPSIKDMASEVTSSIHSAAEAITGDGTKSGAQSALGSSVTESKKITDLDRDMIDVHSKQPMTTDFGHKISNTDNWLKIANDKATGPHLLEDQQAREKASTTNFVNVLTSKPFRRFIASIMNVFLSELFTLGDRLLSENLRFSKARRTLRLHLC